MRKRRKEKGKEDHIDWIAKSPRTIESLGRLLCEKIA
jgi:hypothetical protein